MARCAVAPAARVLWFAVFLAGGGAGPGGARSAGPRLAAASGGGFPSDAAAAACEAWADQQADRISYYKVGCNNYVAQGGTLTACKAWCAATYVRPRLRARARAPTGEGGHATLPRNVVCRRVARARSGRVESIAHSHLPPASLPNVLCATPLGPGGPS